MPGVLGVGAQGADLGLLVPGKASLPAAPTAFRMDGPQSNEALVSLASSTLWASVSTNWLLTPRRFSKAPASIAEGLAPLVPATHLATSWLICVAVRILGIPPGGEGPLPAISRAILIGASIMPETLGPCPSADMDSNVPTILPGDMVSGAGSLPRSLPMEGIRTSGMAVATLRVYSGIESVVLGLRGLGSPGWIGRALPGRAGSGASYVGLSLSVSGSGISLSVLLRGGVGSCGLSSAALLGCWPRNLLTMFLMISVRGDAPLDTVTLVGSGLGRVIAPRLGSGGISLGSWIGETSWPYVATWSPLILWRTPVILSMSDLRLAMEVAPRILSRREAIVWFC